MQPSRTPPSVGTVIRAGLAGISGVIGLLVAVLIPTSAGTNSAQAWPLWLLLAVIGALSLAELAFAYGTWTRNPVALRPLPRALGTIAAVAVIGASLFLIAFGLLLARGFGA